jgi:hypothetical protein
MLDVRSRAGVIAVTTSAAVLVGLPVVAFGQVPVVEPVVNGVTETANSIVQAPPVPAPLPAPPAPAPPPAPAAPAPAPAPQVQAPAPAAPKPAAQAPAAQAPAAQAPAAGSSQARSANTAPKRSSGGGKSSARRGAKAAQPSSKGDGRRGDRGKAKASGDAGASPAEESGGRSNTAIASQEADELPEDPSPAKLPFSGLQLALLAIAGVAALLGGMALRRSTLRSQRAGIVP